jgi:hypothetical protein
MQETDSVMHEEDWPVVKKIQDAIYIMGNHTFWDSKCLVRAIAAMRMLGRRKIASTLYLGTAKDKHGHLIAHAWLRSGPQIITGREEHHKFTVLNTFAKTYPEELDRTRLSKELRLLLMFANKHWDGSLTREQTEQLTEMDWNHFLKLAEHHRIYPYVYSNLTRLGPKVKEWVPEHVTNRLRREFQQNTFRMLALCGEMERIAQTLSDAQIRVLFLKGPGLAIDLYGDLSLRTSRDLDLLIPVEDLAQAERLLVSLGYVKDDYMKTVLGDWKWRHHHLAFFHPAKKTKLEVHWRINPGPSKDPGFLELWDRRRVIRLSKHPIAMLGREDLFLFLVSHGARHGWSRLRWLSDIDKLLEQPVNWNRLLQLLRRYEYEHIAGQALILAKTLLQSPVPEPLRYAAKGKRSRKLAQGAWFYIERMVNLHTVPVPKDVSLYHKRHLFRLMTGRQKLLFVLSFLYPYPEDAETLPLPKQLHFLYFPLRPVLWAVRKLKGTVSQAAE